MFRNLRARVSKVTSTAKPVMTSPNATIVAFETRSARRAIGIVPQPRRSHPDNRAQDLLPLGRAAREGLVAGLGEGRKRDRADRLAHEFKVALRDRLLRHTVLLDGRAGLLANVAAHRVIEQVLRVGPDLIIELFERRLKLALLLGRELLPGVQVHAV